VHDRSALKHMTKQKHYNIHKKQAENKYMKSTLHPQKSAHTHTHTQHTHTHGKPACQSQ
jgi:hypothetical protein